jgi:hypothetical protein
LPFLNRVVRSTSLKKWHLSKGWKSVRELWTLLEKDSFGRGKPELVQRPWGESMPGMIHW